MLFRLVRAPAFLEKAPKELLHLIKRHRLGVISRLQEALQLCGQSSVALNVAEGLVVRQLSEEVRDHVVCIDLVVWSFIIGLVIAQERELFEQFRYLVGLGLGKFVWVIVNHEEACTCTLSLIVHHSLAVNGTFDGPQRPQKLEILLFHALPAYEQVRFVLLQPALVP